MNDFTPNEKQINRMFLCDSLLLVIFTAAVWAVVLIVGEQMTPLADSHVMATAITVIKFAVLMMLTLAVAAVYIHLRRSRMDVYAPEQYWRLHNKAAKR